MNKDKFKKCFKNKVILVTGAAGSIGKEIVKKLLDFDTKVIRALDNNETGLFDLEQELHSDKIRYFIGDIRDKERLVKAMDDVDIVFHTAALKHVPLCEYNPFEAVKTNVVGTENLIEVAREKKVEKFITISTDKAVDPNNVLGASKLLSERLTISANSFKGGKPTIFSCIRFGNVLASRGSVVVEFLRQISKGGPIFITDPRMTRFVMSISQSVNLIIKATLDMKGGEIFILKMPALNIKDLAEVMIDEYSNLWGYSSKDISIKYIGTRPGEKIHEKLIAESEVDYLIEREDMYIILNQPSNIKKRSIRKIDYSSNKCYLLTKEEIRVLLRKNLNINKIMSI